MVSGWFSWVIPAVQSWVLFVMPFFRCGVDVPLCLDTVQKLAFWYPFFLGCVGGVVFCVGFHILDEWEK